MTDSLYLLAIVLVVIGVLYVANRLDEWEEDRELDWLWEESMGRAAQDLEAPTSIRELVESSGLAGALTERGSAKEEMSALQLAGHAPSGNPPRSVSVFDQEIA